MERRDVFLDLTGVEEDDIDQEVALAKLMGVARPSRRIIRTRLLNRYRELLGGFFVGSEEEGGIENHINPIIPVGVDPERELQTVERLVDWALTKSPKVQVLIFQFLEMDYQEQEINLLGVLKTLERLGVEIWRPERKPQVTRGQGRTQGRVVGLVLRALPATQEELLALVTTEHDARRPAATLRQILRRLQREGRIRREGDTFHANVRT